MRCRICDNSSDLVFYDVREMMYGLKESFTYFGCPACGCLQIADIPEDMSKYYPPDYYSRNMPVDESGSWISRIKRLRDRYAVTHKGFIGRILFQLFPDPQPGLYSGLSLNARILDVGCGTGSLIHRLSELGFKNTAGTDPYNPHRIEYINGLVIDNRPLEMIEGVWDMISWHHSFEHIANPQMELRFAADHLSQNGLCLIRIPVSDSWAWKHYRENWVQIDAPRHFFIHSIKSMSIIAEKTGLELKKIEYDSTDFQFWGSEQYQDGISLYDPRSYLVNPSGSSFTRKQIAGFRMEARELNGSGEGDQVIIWLGKKE